MEDFLNLPKVSFIVITHNFENFVCDCLNGIKNQTYKNYEIIVIDDVSEDGTREKTQNYINENPQLNIKYIKNEKNIGQLASFLKALKVATGEFVCSVDGDDILFPEYCAIHVETHLKTSVALTTCQQADIDENNTIHTFCSIESPQKKKTKLNIDCKPYEEFCKYRKACEIDKEGCDIKILNNKKYSFATWHWSPTSSAMMRKSVCDLLLLLDNTDNLQITADKFIFSFCHLIGSSAIIYKVLYAYRRHSGNYSQANPVLGNKKYLTEKTQNNYFRNNRKIRKQMFKFIFKNNEYFKAKFNRTNLILIYKRILFSFDRNFFKGLFKSLFI